MSRQSHLPPRCPLQRKPIPRPNYDPAPPFPTKTFPQHHKSLSQSSIWENQPDWLDNLLEDSEINSKGNSHRRSCSDSHILLDNLTYEDQETKKCDGSEFSALYGPNSPRRMKSSSFSQNEFVSALSKTHAGFDHSLLSHNDGDNSNFRGNENCGDLDSASLYGPNSPRARRSSDFLENAFARGLSESVPQYCLPYVGTNVGGILPGEAFAETNMAKRHDGQRSRVRKLQYIAKLEKSVNFLEALKSELTVRMEALIQKHVTQSTENGKLKLKMARLQEEKFRAEEEHYSLLKEAERLKMKLPNSPSSEGGPYFQSNRGSGDAWSMLDMSRLNIN